MASVLSGASLERSVTTLCSLGGNRGVDLLSVLRVDSAADSADLSVSENTRKQHAAR